MIGLLISSDHLVDISSCEKALETIEKFEKELETSELADDKVKEYIKDARQIIERDLKLYKINNYDNSN